MRLQEKEFRAIKESFAAAFGDGKIYLFGSRTIEIYLNLKVFCRDKFGI